MTKKRRGANKRTDPPGRAVEPSTQRVNPPTEPVEAARKRRLRDLVPRRFRRSS